MKRIPCDHARVEHGLNEISRHAAAIDTTRRHIAASNAAFPGMDPSQTLEYTQEVCDDVARMQHVMLSFDRTQNQTLYDMRTKLLHHSWRMLDLLAVRDDEAAKTAKHALDMIRYEAGIIHDNLNYATYFPSRHETANQ